MPKSNDMAQEGLKKFIEKAKKNLQDLRKEAGTWMKKGELELTRLSRIGKLELDTVKSNIKKEKLFKDIGKKVFELGLGKEIGNSAVEDMCNKVAGEINAMKKRKTEISRAKKRPLKSNIKISKKKK